MSLFSSLYTGVNGMNAQSKATGTISTNIANMTTVGFKKSDTVFHDLVVNNTRPAKFANGGVLTTQVQRIDRQGGLQQTNSSTELAISGDGFFAVKTTDDPAVEFLYTRNGTFSPDNEGVLRNAAGFILYGWPMDLNGNVMGGPTTSTLQAVDVNEFNSQFRATTAGTLSVNLNGAQESINPALIGGTLPVSEQSTWNPLTETSTDNSQPAHFSRNLTVYDNLGNPRQLTFEYRKITGPMAQATTQASGLNHSMSLTDPANFPGIAAGSTLTITAGTASQEYIFGAAAGAGQVRVDTLGELINHVNTQLGDPIPGDNIPANAVDASLDTNGRLILKAVDPMVNLTLAGPAATGPGTLNFPGNNFSPLADVTTNDPAVNPNQSDFPPFANLTDPNTNGWWEVRVLKEPDPSNPLYIEDPLAPGTLIPNPDPFAGQRIEISKGLINFDGLGRLNTPRAPDANGIPDQGPVIDGILTLNSGDFDSDPQVAGEGITVQVDMSRFSQFAGNYNVITAGQNGFEAGTLTGVQITREGLVVASFTNGTQQSIYQIPLATFINPNGLQAMTGTVFAQTQVAGELTMLQAGTGGAGTLLAETVETSNVDLADEFANLIVSQRAFSANSRVVNTVDEMTQQLKQLKG